MFFPLVLATSVIAAPLDCDLNRTQADGGVYTELVVHFLPDAGQTRCRAGSPDGGAPQDTCRNDCFLRVATSVELQGSGYVQNQVVLARTDGGWLAPQEVPFFDFTGCTEQGCTGLRVRSEPVVLELPRGTQVAGGVPRSGETRRLAVGATALVKFSDSLLEGAFTVQRPRWPTLPPSATVVGPTSMLYSVGNIVRARSPMATVPASQELITPRWSWSNGTLSPDCAGAPQLRGLATPKVPGRAGDGFATVYYGMEPTLRVPAAPLSVSMWFQWLGAQNWELLPGTGDTSRTKTSSLISACRRRDCASLLSLYRGKLGWRRAAVETDAGAVFEPDAWHHVALVFDVTRTQVYLDGQLIETKEAVKDLDRLVFGGATSVTSGLPDGGTDPDRTESNPMAVKCSGRLDDVKVFDRALTLDEVRADLLRPQQCH